VMCVCVFFSCL